MKTFVGRVRDALNATEHHRIQDRETSEFDKRRRDDSHQRDEHYVIDLCDHVLGMQGSRQHRFPSFSVILPRAARVAHCSLTCTIARFAWPSNIASGSIANL
jgi:hypothetical protein